MINSFTKTKEAGTAEQESLFSSEIKIGSIVINKKTKKRFEVVRIYNYTYILLKVEEKWQWQNIDDFCSLIEERKEKLSNLIKLC